MKLCILMDYYGGPHAGTESQVIKLVEALLAIGCDLSFAVLRHSDYTRTQQFPVPVECLEVDKLSNPLSWLSLYRFGRRLKAKGVCLAHVFFNDASVIAPPMLSLSGIKTIISRRDMGFWYTPLYRKALPLTGRCVDAAICNSEAVARITRDIEKLPQHRLHVIYNGYPPLVGKAETLKAATRDTDVPVIGLVANLRPIKRIDDLIRAVAIVFASGIKLELQLVGGGDQAPYRALAKELGVEEQIIFVGSHPNPEEVIADFDIAVLCSESEGFSNAIIEYMRCSKPVICTRTGGNPEIVEHGQNGLLVDVGDVTGLADAIRQLISDPETAAAMGQYGAKKVAEDYSMEAMLEAHLRLYTLVCPQLDFTKGAVQP
ncbi:MAG: glycosyl transferase family 1 [Alteromonadaceae bacterium]|nr:glycosyl transferase family 1 [Alteromonadaceae bacterium]MBH87332.1 glycosyl transferase family 1 [Alteromonadaceae bacterium]|tara:strand:- start:39933 stop:41054 length:1122 start_codon:yes stop_codon:yes gene_type:complete